MSTKKKNLDVYLSEIFKQFIAIKDDDFKRSQEVFKHVFEKVKAKMGENSNYFSKYGSQFMYAGSVYDGIKVSKLDEFDMDIVIRLPINYNEDITIEEEQAGFVKLKIEAAFDHLDKQQDWEKCHKVTRDWRDSEKYFLQNKFRFWMHGILRKALNDLTEHVTVNGKTYIVKLGRQSGPAYTLYITNDVGDEPFKLDVDLVPVIRFMHPQWPEGYRKVEETSVKEWLVVPKPHKALDPASQNRCWRLSFQEFEREMMKGCQQLKTTIRLVKKLRDALQMKDIASYYIKTLFLWKIEETKDKKYWQKGLSVLFREMVQELHDALKEGNIKYFWHAENNLIEKLKPTVQKIYVDKLKEVLDAIDNNDVDKVSASLLTVDELQELKRSEFYLKQVEIQQRQLASQLNSQQSQYNRQESNTSMTSNTDLSKSSSKDSTDSGKCSTNSTDSQDATLIELVKALNEKVTAMAEDQTRLKKIESDAKGINSRMNSVVDILKDINTKLDDQNARLKKLEDSFKEEGNQMKDKIDTLMDKLDAQSERLKKLEMINIKSLSSVEPPLEILHNEIRLARD